MGTTPALGIRVERAIDELRRGRGVLVEHSDSQDVVYGLEVAHLDTLLGAAEHAQCQLDLVITRERALAVGHTPPPGVETLCYRWGPDDDGRRLDELALKSPASKLNGAGADLKPGEAHLTSGVKLVKLAKLVPAMGVLRSVCDAPPVDQDGIAWCSLTARDIESYELERAKGLTIVARAAIPLRGQIQSEFVVFRDEAGCDDYVAIVVGDFDTSESPLVRLHSACFTGDLFGSLRCDCGSQLQQAIEAIAEGGGGVLLYLPQEGRGIGLTNKLRAYAIQDEGFDTMEADGHLGFKADERSYESAARMLSALGIVRIRLLTNSPHKIEALENTGIEIAGRIPLTTIPNPYNTPYLRAKAEKAGHWLEDVL